MAARATTVTCNQMRPAPAGVSVTRGTMPAVPLLVPLGARSMSNIRREAPRLFSAVSNQLDSAAPGFVRPDCPPDYSDSDSEAAPIRNVGTSGAAAAAFKRFGGPLSPSTDEDKPGKPSFRSALEQASYMTSTEQAGRADSRRSGKFGLGFLGL